MGLLARRSRIAAKRNLPITPQTSGYIGEFLNYVLAPLLPRLLANKTRVITNAGGLDPIGLKQLIEKHLEENGFKNVKVAAVWGDDLIPKRQELFQKKAFKSFDPLNGAGLAEEVFTEQDSLLSLNAYLGAQPIVEALRSGAQIIVTGRVVDSALVLAPLAYTYNWDLSPVSPHLNYLASASLAGHIIECGAQCTGGNFTDWRDGAFSSYGAWSNMGYPIVEFNSDASFIVTKPAKTGGVVSKLSVTEQILYEVLDPANYLLPDVNLDLTNVTVEQVGVNRVKITGARGRPPTEWLKGTAIKQDGYRIEGALIIPGFEARQKARILGEALIQRANMILKGTNMAGIEEYRVETPGSEEMFGRVKDSREVILRISAAHQDKRALDILGMELAYSATSTAPGITPLMSSGRAKASPRFVSSSVLVRRDFVTALVATSFSPPTPVPFFTSGCRDLTPSSSPEPPFVHPSGRLVPLHIVCVGRSGDKGDSANIAIIARHPYFYPHLTTQLTPNVIRRHLAHLIDKDGVVERFLVPGVSAVNFVVTKCLGGGGLGSLRLDRQGKGFAQVILGAVEVWVPDEIVVELSRNTNSRIMRL